MFKRLLWFIKSDIELRTTTVWKLDKKKYIDGFYFFSKAPFSKTYQWHSTLGLENTYNILEVIQKSIKQKKRATVIEIEVGLGLEKLIIWKGSFRKAEKQMFDMIKEIQQQY